MKKTVVWYLLLALWLSYAPPVAAAPSSDDDRTQLSLSASSPSPYPGDTINVQANVSPRFDETKYGIRWEWQGGAANFRAESGDVVAYEALQEPVTLSATLWDRMEGGDVVTATLTVPPRSYAFSIRNLTPEETISLWDPEARAMADVQGRTVRSRVTLEAVLEPQPQGALRYLWTPNEGTFLASENENQCVVYRETQGSAVVSLRVSDKNNVTLGTAEFSFEVNISSKTLEQSRRLTKGWDLWKGALALREKGEIETALIQARYASEELIGGGVGDDVLRGELERFKQVRDSYFNALELASIAAALWRDDKLEDALAQYRQARTFYAHASIEKNIAEIEALLVRAKKLQEDAAVLAQEAERLAKAGDLEGALAKYDESLTLHSDLAVRAAQADVEALHKAIQRKMEVAETVRKIGLTLESQDNLEDALAKMTESREIWDLPAIAADAERIQSKIADRRRRQDEAARLVEEAALLEVRGLEGQGEPDILNQALGKYRQALDVWWEISSERALERVSSHIGRIENDIAQSAFLAKEGELLEGNGQLEEALNKYRRAQDIRGNEDVAKKVAELDQRLETRKKLAAEAQEHYLQAVKLENLGNLDEALAIARRGETLLASNDLTVRDLAVGDLSAGDVAATVKRLENAIDTRNGKIARAADLAARAREESHPEKSLDLFIESENVWHNEEVAQMIRTLRELLKETRDAEERAAELYKEGVILERDSKLEAAEEKLQSSIALKPTAEAEKLLSEVQKQIAEKNWVETLSPQPLELKSLPLIPYAGERTTVRIENGAWTVDDKLTYRWKLSGNVKDDAPIGDGRAYGFYPVDDQPVTLALTVLQKGKERVLTTRTISVIAEPRAVKLTLNEETRTAKLWNATSKRLEEANEFATGTDVEIRAEVTPLPEGLVSYSWNADPDSILVASLDSRAIVRRPSPGMSKVDVTVKDGRGIVLGSGRLDFLVAVDKNDIARDLKRSQAWEQWMAARNFWSEGRRLQAIDTATEASLLDPLDPDITSGLSRMKEDLGKMEQAAQLLAEGSFLLADGRITEAEEKIGAAENLWQDEKNRDIRYSLLEAVERVRKNEMLALNLRAEGDALLARGAKIEALLRFQDSLLLSENDAVSKDIARLTQEIATEKSRLEEARTLRNKGDALVEGKHYGEAIEYFDRSMTLYPDPYLAAYRRLLQERADREKMERAKASKLRGEGDALMKNKKTAEALAKYKESLQIWHDTELAATVKEEENRLAQATAAQLRKEADALVKGKKIAEALAKYKESLTYAHNDAAAAYVKKTEEAEAKRRSDALIKEADALVKQKKPEEALARYRLAQKETPKNEALLATIRKLELILAPAVGEAPLSDDVALPENPYENTSSDQNGRDLVQADALYREGNALYRQKKYKEALQKYRESYKLSQSQKLLDFADQLEATLENVEKANKLVREANTLYKAQKYKEALTRYRESLDFYANPEVRAFILKVEALLK
ncbi:MAG: tetratricopeptide repeat protein [Synergistaceae bacterium]|jgi:tetratricopeptide (TPR) repeat protein|nr:tetratricopeptide repeat protein [Synergistaceae bacterium]